VVPSPRPQRVVELSSVLTLLQTPTVVICGGGGGAPVLDDGTGRLAGVEAVVDKDLTAAMLAEALAADRLLVLTDVPAVLRDFGTPNATEIRELATSELGEMGFPAGSMGPEIDACRRFVEATGHPAAIGAMSDAAAILAGTAGTSILAHRTRVPAGSR
jgi:carbamate kinase